MKDFAYRANFDFEFKLFGLGGQPKINKSLECLYFWSSDTEPLVTSKSYCSYYLSYIEKLTHKKISLCESAEKIVDWWGDSYNHKELNARTTIASLRSKDSIAMNDSELRKKVSSIGFPSIIKESFSVAGKGSYIVNTESKLESLYSKLSFPVVVEPLLDRKIDLGCIWESTGGRHQFKGLTVNQIDHKLTYSGGFFNKNQDLLLKYIEGISGQNIDELISWQRDLLRDLNSRQVYEGLLSIDCFYYDEDKSINLYPASEVNGRKTMGTFLMDVSRLYGNDLWVKLDRLDPRKMKSFGSFQDLIDSLGELNFNSSKKSGAVILSPLDAKIGYALVSGATVDEAHQQSDTLIGKLYKT